MSMVLTQPSNLPPPSNGFSSQVAQCFLSESFRHWTFAIPRALHNIIGDALNEIEGVYSAHGQSLEAAFVFSLLRAVPSTEATASVSSPLSSPGTRGTDSHSIPRHKPALSNATSYAYVSPPPSPCISSPPERIPPLLDH